MGMDMMAPIKHRKSSTALSRIGALPGRIRRFAAQRKGAVAINFGIVLIPLMGLTGLTIDGSRALLTRYQFQSALDSAALSVGSTYTTQEELKALADAYVAKNFKVPGATVTNISVNDTGGNVIVTGTFTLDTYFMSIFGQPTLALGATTEVKRAGGGLLVTLVLDNTGSMWGSNNIKSLRDASDSLTKNLFGDDTAPADLRVGIVPYASMVNPGDEAPGLLPPGDSDRMEYFPNDKTKWKGCVVEREGWDLSMSDDAPGTGKYWKRFEYPRGDDNNYDPSDPDTIDPGGDRNSNGFTGPNVGCPTPITPLTNSKSTIDAAVRDLTAWNRGGTLTDIGVAWGLRVLSPGAPFTESAQKDPKTQTLDPSTGTLDPSTGESLWQSTRWRKAMVIMTDGESLFYRVGNASPNKKLKGVSSDYTGYERLKEGVAKSIFGNDNANNARNDVNKRIAALCTRAKSQGIIVYTVVFTSRVNNTTKKVYQDCASDPGKFWYAPNKTALNDSFAQIGSDLSRLRITR